VVRTFQSLKLSPNEQKQPIGPSQLDRPPDYQSQGQEAEVFGVEQIFAALRRAGNPSIV
jgi:hypothetical protein